MGMAICAAVVWQHNGFADEKDSVFAPNAKPIQVLTDGAGEGPAWHPELGLFFSGNNQIRRLGRDGQVHVFRNPSGSNGLLLDARLRLLTCEPGQRRVTRTDPKNGQMQVLAERFEGNAFNQPNDITVDSRGRIYFTDPRYGSRDGMDIRDSEGRVVEGVYRIDPDGSLSRIITHEVDRPNGLAVTADDRYLFVADNNNNSPDGARKLWRFDLSASGTISVESRRLIYDWESGRGPDGMALDTAGRLYVAGGRNKPTEFETAAEHRGGIYVFSPQGDFLNFVAVPNDEVTNCSFGGDDMRTLYITAGGTLWSIRTAAAGFVRWTR
jgi:gluconolactonase